MDFRERYETEYPDQLIAEIGVPRIVLVGLGVDDRAKRMVQFLAKSSLDISLVTFYGFKLAGETLLARQVEVQATLSQGAVGSKKAANQAELNRVLAKLGIRQNYDALITATQKGLASSIYYHGKVQLVLQARALEAGESFWQTQWRELEARAAAGIMREVRGAKKIKFLNSHKARD